MEKTKRIVFGEENNIFGELLNDYDYKMMVAKDNIVASVLSEMIKYLNSTFKTLLNSDRAIRITLNKEDEYYEILPEILVELADTTDFRLREMDFSMPDIVVRNYNFLKIFAKENKKTIELYQIGFDKNATYLIIQNSKEQLIYDCSENSVIDNTFTDIETNAILYTMGIVIGGTSKKHEVTKNNVIDMAAYRNKKRIKKNKF